MNRFAKAALLLAMSLVQPGQAQTPGSVTEFQLPPGKEAPPPSTEEGPLDPEMPAPVQGIPTPSQADEPPAAAQAPATTTNSAPASPPPTVIPTLPVRPDASSPVRMARRSPVPEADPASAPPAPEQAPAILPDESLPALSAAPREGVATGASLPGGSPPSWIWWFGGGALLALLLAGLGFVLRRRQRGMPEPGEIEEAEKHEDPSPQGEEAPVSSRRTGIPQPLLSPDRIGLAFEPRRLTMAMVNARLAYGLSLTNRGDAAFGPISIACDIISANASLNDRQQLLFGGEMDGPIHRFDSLGPGETLSLDSELQIPIAAIQPVRSGDASLFVPLARFRVAVLDADRPPLVTTRIFIVGESPERAGMRLRPIRIDLGPRIFSHIGQRELEPS